jgi:hypothetical protein
MATEVTETALDRPPRNFVLAFGRTTIRSAPDPGHHSFSSEAHGQMPKLQTSCTGRSMSELPRCAHSWFGC